MPRERLLPTPFEQSTLKYEELSRLVQIDKNRLDDAFVDQPNDYLQIAEGKADAINHKDRAKYALELVEATEDARIRNMTLPAGKKLTETSIKSMIIESDIYHKARTELANWSLLADKWWGLLIAMTQRSNALDQLAYLWRSSYWSRNNESPQRLSPAEASHERVREHLANARVERGVLEVVNADRTD